MASSFFLRASCALGGVCLFAGAAAASPVNIDTFDIATTPVAFFGGTPISGYAAVTNPPIVQTIGGVRGYAVTSQGTGAGATTLSYANGMAGLGTLTISAPYSGQWTLTYGYDPNGQPSDLNADLINDNGTPNTGLLIKMAKAEHPYNLALTVTTNTVTSPAVTLTNLPANPNPYDVFVPFSSFSGVNFHDIDQISVTWTGSPDGDYTVDAIIASTPEPATMMLLAAGALVAVRRRSR